MDFKTTDINKVRRVVAGLHFALVSVPHHSVVAHQGL